ncbi:MAG: TetR family transcriptional regulator C-terminal domain-containing protein [Methylococcales bacterium]|nr:TetR family transcriptional regulator C-terminal domain-containing protein [Methylococcales bacterium]
MTVKIQKQINRDNLLSQGVALLMAHGYHGTGLKALLDAVNIPKGSFYNYFGSKEQFGAEAIQHYIEPFIQQLNSCLAQNPDDSLAAIRGYFRQHISELQAADFQGGCLLGNLMGEIGDSSEVCRQSLQNAVARYRNTLQAGLTRAQTQGRVRTDKTAGELADILVNAWQGVLLRAKIEKSTLPLDQYCRDLLDDYIVATQQH